MDRSALSAETIRELAASRGLPLTADQVAGVQGFQRAMAGDLARLRSVPLDFVGDLRIPADATAWLEGFPEIGPEGRPVPVDREGA